MRQQPTDSYLIYNSAIILWWVLISVLFSRSKMCKVFFNSRFKWMEISAFFQIQWWHLASLPRMTSISRSLYPLKENVDLLRVWPFLYSSSKRGREVKEQTHFNRNSAWWPSVKNFFFQFYLAESVRNVPLSLFWIYNPQVSTVEGKLD